MPRPGVDDQHVQQNANRADGSEEGEAREWPTPPIRRGPHQQPVMKPMKWAEPNRPSCWSVKPSAPDDDAGCALGIVQLGPCSTKDRPEGRINAGECPVLAEDGTRQAVGLGLMVNSCGKEGAEHGRIPYGYLPVQFAKRPLMREGLDDIVEALTGDLHLIECLHGVEPCGPSGEGCVLA